MYKIMFVCHGNICRSPMAEFIFKDLLEKKGLTDRFLICSSATSSEEIFGGIGNPVYPPAKRELAKHAINCEGKRAVQLKKNDYDKYDLFVGMDTANVINMKRIFGHDFENKIRMLMSFTSRPGSVDDPWFSDRFDIAYNDINEGCTCLLEYLLKK